MLRRNNRPSRLRGARLSIISARGRGAAMTATTEPQPRIATLVIVRGVAVMGILAMNVIAFAMHIETYMIPAASALDTPADFLVSALKFLFVDRTTCGLSSFPVGVTLADVIHRPLPTGDREG